MALRDRDAARIPPPGGTVNVNQGTRALKRHSFSRGGAREMHRRPRSLPGRTAILAFGLAAFVALTRGIAAQPGAPERIYPVRYVSCAGWGLCAFRLIEPDPLLGPIVQVRLRGIGDPGLAGICTPEREAARTVREFVQDVLARATRIGLSRVDRRPDSTVLATVLVDGTDVTDVVIHIGFGRGLRMAPGSDWCD